MLADTRAGGLRKDWSALYGPGGTEATTSAFGAYLNTRPAAVNDANFVADYAPSLPVPSVAVGNPTPGFGVAPVITEAGIRFTFEESGGQIRLRYQLVVELWNPYAARINAGIAGSPSMQVNVRFPDMTDVRVSGTGDPVTFDIIGVTVTAAVPTSTTWEAGQVLVFYSDGPNLSTSTGSLTSRPITASGGLTDLNEISLPAVPLDAANAFTVRLESPPALGGMPERLWQQFTLQGITLTAGTSSLNPVIPTPAAAIGFELNRNLEQWTNGSLAASSDPRWHDHNTTTFYEPFGSGTWSLDPTQNASLTFAAGVFSDNPTRRFILFDLPRQEVTNLAQLRHVVNTKPYAIANSWGLTANAVFDKAFFSTLPRSAAIPVDPTTPLPSPHHELYVPAGVAAPALATLRDKLYAARYMLINGVFNINCLDMRVWWAQIAHDRANYIFNNGAGGETDISETATTKNPVFRVPHGAQQLLRMPFPNNNLATSAQLSTYNIPVDSQPYLRAAGRIMNGGAETQLLTEALATRIRAANGGRPFASIEDFITTLTAGKSVLQTAIDTGRHTPLNDPSPTEKNINQLITDPTHRFTAGAVTPADLIASIAPFITVRGDTFRIRAYGESINPTTLQVEGTAWCEAVIQRTPELVSNPNASDDDVIAPTPAGSGDFGRRFVITSFRWLSPQDI